jgi:hypothetical protein
MVQQILWVSLGNSWSHPTQEGGVMSLAACQNYL